MKSEDILFEIKKIQQTQVLAEGMKCDLVRGGKSEWEAEAFMLGILNTKIYNMDTESYEIQKWTQLSNVRCFYDFLSQGNGSLNK